MRFLFSRGNEGASPSRAKRPRLPQSRDQGQALTPEEERNLDGDDLAELLAATNAKRLARGKQHLTQDDVEIRLWAEEQKARRHAVSEPVDDPLDDGWGL